MMRFNSEQRRSLVFQVLIEESCNVQLRQGQIVKSFFRFR